MAYHNRLLAALPSDERKKLELVSVQLPFKEVIHDVGEPVTCVVFPTNGVVSVVNEPNEGEIVEVATIGSEGVVGLSVAFGTDSVPNRAIVQIPGEGMRGHASVFARFVEDHEQFRKRLMRYTMALMNQIAQNASCNRLHEVQERCARWLLQTHDRVDSDSFPLTQDFLAQMLGVHRPTVSIAAAMLQKAGLIEYVRGAITILDRAGLEQASCSCYRFIRQEYDRLLPPDHRRQ